MGLSDLESGFFFFFGKHIIPWKIPSCATFQRGKWRYRRWSCTEESDQNSTTLNYRIRETMDNIIGSPLQPNVQEHPPLHPSPTASLITTLSTFYNLHPSLATSISKIIINKHKQYVSKLPRSTSNPSAVLLKIQAKTIRKLRQLAISSYNSSNNNSSNRQPTAKKRLLF